jgi:hypothetical protein
MEYLLIFHASVFDKKFRAPANLSGSAMRLQYPICFKFIKSNGERQAASGICREARETGSGDVNFAASPV